MKIINSLILLILLSGCSGKTMILHSGQFQVNTPNGDTRHALVYWTSTNRPYWFNTQSGSIRVLTECSTNTILFDESEDGIIFRRRQTDKSDSEIQLNGECGRVLNAERIIDITDQLVFTIQCESVTNMFTITDTEYPSQTNDLPYVVDINQNELENIPKLECKL